ncbi:MAG: hypothetical protein JZU50_05735 [Desulfobulbaceae bacterium]|nr:hypothetical protein [Desulfobulbaceae bacterium]
MEDLEGHDGQDYDYILLTTKTYGTTAAIEAPADLASCSCPVVSMQNGCGNLEQLEQRFGNTRSMAARVITGFTIERPGSVRITVSADNVHVGGSRRGKISEADQLTVNWLSHLPMPGFPVSWSPIFTNRSMPNFCTTAP